MEVASRIISFIVPGFADLSAAEQLVQLKAVDHVVRKIAHFSEYAILGALVANLLHTTAEPGKWRQLAPRYVAVAWILATAYAVTDEIHQIFVPGRSCMFTDVLIDSAGVLVGVLLFAGALALKKR